MRTGVPIFVGSRLRQAREARGLTIISLAELLGISKQAISQYEIASSSPRPEVLEQIASILRMPVQFFFRPVLENASPKIFYRSMSTATKTARTRGEHRYSWLREIVGFLSELVEFPKVQFPSFELPTNPFAITDEQVESSASQTRKFWGLGDGPISNVTWLLENKGAVVCRTILGADTLDAFSEWNLSDRKPYFILGADLGSASRSRFDAAHELGHIVLHRQIDRTSFTRPAEFRQIEEQAHRFAAYFLLPPSSFVTDFYVPSLDALRALKSKWHVSIGMMLMHADRLDLISEHEKLRLWRSYARRGWKSTEPLDTEIPVEKPRMLRQCFELITSKQILSRDAILSMIPLNPSDIEELAGLPNGFCIGEELVTNLLSFPKKRGSAG